MVCIADKHRLKVGEPGFPVAAAECGRRVIVCAGTTLKVGDHDFTKFSIIPSVSLLVDIPDRHSKFLVERPSVGWVQGCCI